MKEYKSKKEFREALNNMDAIEIYEEVLRGKYLKKFPDGFWQRPEAEQNMIQIVKYMIEEKLKWDEEDIKEKISIQVFRDNNISSILNHMNLYKVLNLIYPDTFKPWDLKYISNGYWNDDEHIKDAVKWLIEEKLKWDEEDIKEKISIQVFKDNGFRSILRYKSLYEIINMTYPDKFKPWDLKYISNGYWNDENHITEAVKWLIEDKLKWNEEDIKENYCQNIFKINGLTTILNIKSLYEIINMTYPNKFKPTDFKHYERFKGDK